MLRLAVAMAVGIAVFCGCTSDTPAHLTPSASSPVGPTQATPTGVVTATEREDGRKLQLHRGEHLRVVLSSTYWRFAPDAAPDILRRVGAPQVRSHTAHCIPGGGCGTVTATFLAAAPGRATVAASRTSCGEAMRCTGHSGEFGLIVVVS